MYRDVLQPGDTFTMMMRKLVVAIGAFGMIVPVIVIIQSLLGISTSTTTTTSTACYILMVVIGYGTWIYVCVCRWLVSAHETFRV